MQSKAGPILIALNPFKDLQIYGNDYVSTYRQQLVDTPHVYGMVDAAYNQMMRGEWGLFPSLYFKFCVATELQVYKTFLFVFFFLYLADEVDQSIIIRSAY